MCNTKLDCLQQVKAQEHEHSCLSVSYTNTKMALKIANLVPSKLDTKIYTHEGKNELKTGLVSLCWQVCLLIVLHLFRALSKLVLIASRKSDVLT